MNSGRLVAGIDCSTQSTKVVVCDAETGEVRRQGQAPHPDDTQIHPEMWWRAYLTASHELLDDVSAIAVGGQQHGMVTVDQDGQVVRPALLWNDMRSAQAASDLVAELGGAGAWAEAVGSVPLASFTVTKLRWLAENEPETARRVNTVMLPHDWLTWQLAAGHREATTDRGDASGTGYWSPGKEQYRDDLLRMAFGRDLATPRVAAPAETVATTAQGQLIAAGTGDNMAAALGLDARPGDIVVSLGTSGTVFAVSQSPIADDSGQIAGFADATGRHLPLVCTLNAARVLDTTAQLLEVDAAGLNWLALHAEPGAGGLTMLPYLDGERVPNLPEATGSLYGMTRHNLTPANLARACVEGMLCGLADGVDALLAQGIQAQRILLIGGAAQSQAVQEVAAHLFGMPVEVPRPAEYVALGAARQAAWALSGERRPPRWHVDGEPLDRPSSDAPGQQIRETYAQHRDTLLAAR